jgi:hypothetical protein
LIERDNFSGGAKPGLDGRVSIGGGIKWKKKSELSDECRMSIASKSRISIKGTSQYEYILKEDDPFKVKPSANIKGMSSNNGEEVKS